MQFKPLSKTTYFYFISNFIILGVLGAKHVEAPFIEIGQISTTLYFSFFVLIIPVLTLIENTFSEIGYVGAEKSFISYTGISCKNNLGYRNYTTLRIPNISIINNIIFKLNYLVFKYNPQIIILFIYAIYILSFNLLSVFLFLHFSIPSLETLENFIIYLYDEYSYDQGLYILNMDPGQGSSGDNGQGDNPTPDPSGGGGPNPGGGNNPEGFVAVLAAMASENQQEDEN
jgi:hypothetical protein